MLKIEHLYKKFGNFYAVNDLNLHISPGEIFGFVGHNGAGKTTTMKITVGLLAATGGNIYIEGVDAFKNYNKIKRKIGYMPDFFGVYDNLKALEYMEFYASLYGIVGKQARSACLALMDLVNLADQEDTYVDSLSRGMKQRLCLARSLVHDPGLLVLDEPASGLDPRARFEMKEILKNLGSMGKTVIISSHILPELADMCDTIGIMQKGKLIMHGTVDDIQMRAMHARTLHVRVLDRQEEAVRILQEDPHSRRVSVREDYLVSDYTGDDGDSAQLLRRLMQADIPVESFYKEKGNLESLFLELTGHDGAPAEMREEAAGEGRSFSGNMTSETDGEIGRTSRGRYGEGNGEMRAAPGKMYTEADGGMETSSWESYSYTREGEDGRSGIQGGMSYGKDAGNERGSGREKDGKRRVLKKEKRNQGGEPR